MGPWILFTLKIPLFLHPGPQALRDVLGRGNSDSNIFTHLGNQLWTHKSLKDLEEIDGDLTVSQRK